MRHQRCDSEHGLEDSGSRFLGRVEFSVCFLLCQGPAPFSFLVDGACGWLCLYVSSQPPRNVTAFNRLRDTETRFPGWALRVYACDVEAWFLVPVFFPGWGLALQ